MRSMFLALAAIAAMMLGSTTAQAGFIVGGVSFGGDVQNNSSGTVLDTRNVVDLSKTSGSGPYASSSNGGYVASGTSWGTFTLTNPMTALSISSATFGTFTSTSLTSDSGSSGIVNGSGNRTLVFAGGFTPGTLFAAGNFDPTSADITVTLNQSTTNFGLPGETTFFSITVAMTSFNAPPSTVPEPASMAIFGLGALGLAARRFRRK